LWQQLVATWAEFQQSIMYDATDQWRKKWKQVSTQKVVILNTCGNIACLTFQLPKSQEVLFRATNANPQPVLSEPPNN